MSNLINDLETFYYALQTKSKDRNNERHVKFETSRQIKSHRDTIFFSLMRTFDFPELAHLLTDELRLTINKNLMISNVCDFPISKLYLQRFVNYSLLKIKYFKFNTTHPDIFLSPPHSCYLFLSTI